jgi:RNA polymerase sigma-70 factor (ECF subfamily)
VFAGIAGTFVLKSKTTNKLPETLAEGAAHSETTPSADRKRPVEVIEQEVVALYAEFAPGLLRYGISLTPDSALVEEAIQEVFLTYFSERRAQHVISDPRGWLFRALRNCLRNGPEPSAAPPTVSMEGLADVPDRQQNPEADLHRKQVWSRVTSRLSTREFECLCLRAEGLSYQQIAEAMGIRQGTVGAVLARGLKKLHRLL